MRDTSQLFPPRGAHRPPPPPPPCLAPQTPGKGRDSLSNGAPGITGSPRAQHCCGGTGGPRGLDVSHGGRPRAARSARSPPGSRAGVDPARTSRIELTGEREGQALRVPHENRFPSANANATTTTSLPAPLPGSPGNMAAPLPGRDPGPANHRARSAGPNPCLRRRTSGRLAPAAGVGVRRGAVAARRCLPLPAGRRSSRPTASGRGRSAPPARSARLPPGGGEGDCRPQLLPVGAGRGQAGPGAALFGGGRAPSRGDEFGDEAASSAGMALGEEAGDTLEGCGERLRGARGEWDPHGVAWRDPACA